MNDLAARTSTPRRRLLSLPGVVALLGALLLGSCRSALRERGVVEAFESAVVMDDGRTALFTANRARFEYVGGDPWGKGTRSFTRDELLIGAYDLESGEARVLHVEDAEPHSAARTRFRIRSTRGPYALLHRTCGADVEDTSRAGWYRLDARTGALERLDLARDLERRGAGKLINALLVSDAGELVALSKPVEGQERHTLSLRRVDGTWEEVASDAQYRGVRGEELLFWIPQERFQAWSLATGARRAANPWELVGLDHERETKPKAAVMPRDQQRDTGSYLELYPDRADSSVRRRLALSVADLAAD